MDVKTGTNRPLNKRSILKYKWTNAIKVVNMHIVCDQIRMWI